MTSETPPIPNHWAVLIKAIESWSKTLRLATIILAWSVPGGLVALLTRC